MPVSITPMGDKQSTYPNNKPLEGTDFRGLRRNQYVAGFIGEGGLPPLGLGSMHWFHWVFRDRACFGEVGEQIHKNDKGVLAHPL